ncbi:MAG: sialate O-acetylesterase [Cocleimonas sp.]
MKTLFILSGLLLQLISTNTYADKIDLFIMAGQSNMQGWRSDAASYPADKYHLDQLIPFYFRALNYDSSNNKWETLRPQKGHFRKGHFGPEVTFSRALLNNKRLKPAIFKYSSGGSSLKLDWKTYGKKGLYDDMVHNLRIAIKGLEAQGHTVVPRAIIWIQGESDAENEQLANEYYWHLKRMLTHLRNNIIHEPNLPVILSVDELHPRVQQHPQVVNAQMKLALENSNISFVSMMGLEKYDSTHLTAKGTIQQGKRIFSAYNNLKGTSIN